jgi:hypothetical protein
LSELENKNIWFYQSLIINIAGNRNKIKFSIFEE